ncbi:DUF6011 domain-containing protein [Microbispora bryophytorum]|uniref:DUF6011 domain-containing protein n=1 Tax=Microbispora bryophytorum TaxID=1460882 RepID=UPI0033C42CDA
MTELDEQPALWEEPDDADGGDATRARPRWRGRCEECHHPVRVPQSLAWRVGPKCRRKLGLNGPRPPTIRTRAPGAIAGQLDLLQLLERISA